MMWKSMIFLVLSNNFPEMKSQLMTLFHKRTKEIYWDELPYDFLSFAYLERRTSLGPPARALKVPPCLNIGHVSSKSNVCLQGQQWITGGISAYLPRSPTPSSPSSPRSFLPSPSGDHQTKTSFVTEQMKFIPCSRWRSWYVDLHVILYLTYNTS